MARDFGRVDAEQFAAEISSSQAQRWYEFYRWEREGERPAPDAILKKFDAMF